jgi:hypothetical protein
MLREVGHVPSDDGIFYMPVKDFKIAFNKYSICIFMNWNVDQKEVNRAGERHWYKVVSRTTQDMIITLDYQNPRGYGYGCPKPKVWFNIYFLADGALVSGPAGVSDQTGYGYDKVKVKANKTYHILVVNWEDASYKADYTLATYAAQSRVRIRDAEAPSR